MPTLELKTNVKLEDAKPFIQEFSKVHRPRSTSMILRLTSSMTLLLSLLQNSSGSLLPTSQLRTHTMSTSLGRGLLSLLSF